MSQMDPIIVSTDASALATAEYHLIEDGYARGCYIDGELAWKPVDQIELCKKIQGFLSEHRLGHRIGFAYVKDLPPTPPSTQLYTFETDQPKADSDRPAVDSDRPEAGTSKHPHHHHHDEIPEKKKRKVVADDIDADGTKVIKDAKHILTGICTAVHADDNLTRSARSALDAAIASQPPDMMVATGLQIAGMSYSMAIALDQQHH